MYSYYDILVSFLIISLRFRTNSSFC